LPIPASRGARRLALLAVAIAGCSSGASGGAPPSTDEGTTSEPLRQDAIAQFGPQDLAAALALADLRDSRVGFANGRITFTPSLFLSFLAYGDFNGGAHTTTFATPTVTSSPPWPQPDVTAFVTSFSVDMAAVAITMDMNGIEIDVPFGGTLHIQTSFPWPNGDLVLQPGAKVHATLAWDPRGQTFTVHTSAFVPESIQGCGAFGWCNQLLQDNLPNLSSELARVVETTLTDQIAAGTKALRTVLLARWNQLHQSDRGGVGPWALVPGSITYIGNTFFFRVTRGVDPLPLPVPVHVVCPAGGCPAP
jgi:hypothetical protein